MKKSFRVNVPAEDWRGRMAVAEAVEVRERRATRSCLAESILQVWRRLLGVEIGDCFSFMGIKMEVAILLCRFEQERKCRVKMMVELEVWMMIDGVENRDTFILESSKARRLKIASFSYLLRTIRDTREKRGCSKAVFSSSKS